MNWVDVAIVAVIVLSAVIGFFRGFLREVVGLATWVLAFYVAFTTCQMAAAWFEPWIGSESIRVAAAFVAIFIAVLILGAIVNYIIGKLVDKTGFAGTDRSLGGVFGILRGAAILVLLVLLAGMTPLPEDAWWQESVFIDHLEDGAITVRGWLPDRFADSIAFPSEHRVVDQPPQTSAARGLPDRPVESASSSS